MGVGKCTLQRPIIPSTALPVVQLEVDQARPKIVPKTRNSKNTILAGTGAEALVIAEVEVLEHSSKDAWASLGRPTDPVTYAEAIQKVCKVYTGPDTRKNVRPKR